MIVNLSLSLFLSSERDLCIRIHVNALHNRTVLSHTAVSILVCVNGICVHGVDMYIHIYIYICTPNQREL